MDQSFDNIVQVESLNTLEAKGSDSIDTIDEIEDEGISDISTHETIINPSSGNDKYFFFLFKNVIVYIIKGFQCIH